MAPVGGVTFDSVPQRWVAFCGEYADVAVALGRADGLAGIGGSDCYYTTVYEELPGVEVDEESLERYPEVRTKEAFYELDCDVQFYDQQMLVHWFDWSEDDVAEIADNVAPFLGNVIFRRTDAWHDYRYYSLYEAFERFAEVLRERARFEAIRSTHDDLVATVQSRLPAPNEGPNAALVFAGEEPEGFTPYRLSGNGANKEHFHTLGISDAFSGSGIDGLSTSDTGTIDYEALLEVDPDSLLLRYHRSGKSGEEFEDTVLGYMEDHEVGSQLTAVQNDMVFRGGPIYAGPLHNLFMIERYALAYFPDAFDEDRLIDRDRLSTIVMEGVDGGRS